MAIVTIRNGDQLPQARAKAKANFDYVVSIQGGVSVSDVQEVGSGMGLEPFRGVCDRNFTNILTLVGTKSQGTLTVDTQVAVDDTITIGTTTYTFKAGATAAVNQIGIGASLAAVKLAIVAAIEGNDSFNEENPDVSAAAFLVNDCILTAKVAGVAGDLIATTSSFTTGTNLFDDVTLGTTTAGSGGAPGGFTEINDGDMLWQVRAKLNTNFALAAVV